MSVDVPAWVGDAVFYQIFPDRFASTARVPKPGPMEPWESPPTVHGFKGGDLLGIAERLDELTDLGITALYLNPIFASASNHRYHTYDYLTVDPLLGGDAALRELLDAAHGRGVRVVLDGVFNHASRGFWPFHHVLETGAASPYRGWFHLNEPDLEAGRPLRAYSHEAPRAPQQAEAWEAQDRTGRRSLRTLGYRAWWDLPALPKLNTDNPDVRAFLFGVAEHWLRFGIDGWRLDVPLEIEDAEFWREFRRRVRAVNPEAYIVAEIWHEAPEVLRGDQFDALMNYPLAQAVLSFVAGPHLDRAAVAEHPALAAGVRPEDAATFLRRVERSMTLYDPAVTRAQLNLLGSHDTPRFLTMVGGDRDALRLAWLVQMTLPGAPCIYYGDELGMEGHMDPDCRRTYPRDPAAGDRALRAYLRALVRVRHEHRVLRHGSFGSLVGGGPAAAYALTDATSTVVVALNAGDRPQRIDVVVPGAGTRLVAEPLPGDGAADPIPLVDGRASVDLPPRAARLLRLTDD